MGENQGSNFKRLLLQLYLSYRNEEVIFEKVRFLSFIWYAA